MEDRLFLLLGHGYPQYLLLVAGIVLVIAKMATRSLQLVPKGCQNVIEAYLEGLVSMGMDTIGKKEKVLKYIPLIATFGLMIFVANMIGIIPGFESPSGNINFTLTLALTVFFFYHFEGIKAQGIGHYIAHFAGPVKWLAPLMFPIEVISHISRIISLSFRLFGSIKGDDMFLMVLLMLVPWLIPTVGFFALFAFGALQTFIFMMLTFVYLAGAVAIEENH